MSTASGMDNQVDCAYCGTKENDDQWVQCDQCKTWVHYKCAQVNDDIKNKEWLCRKCTVAKNLSNKVIHSPKKANGSDKQAEHNDSVERVSENKTGNENRKKKLELELQMLYKKLELLNEISSVSEVKRQLETKQENIPKIKNSNIVEIPKERIEGFQTKACGGCDTSKIDATLFDLKKLNIRQAVPKDLPEFRMNLEWLLFFTTFEGTTKMCGYSDEENLLRLRKALKGKAYEAVNGLLSSHKCMPQIISTLKMLYGAPERIVENLLSKVRKTPPLNGENATQIINYGLEVRNLVATMENAELNEYINNPFILAELTEKLPFYMQISWSETIQKPDRDLKTFSEWLFKKAEVASQLPKSNVYESKSTGTRSHRINMHNGIEDKTQVRCYFCKGDHMMTKCSEFAQLDVNGRWNKVRELRLCYVCFGRHMTQNCRKAKECRINGCKYKHNRLLHRYEQERVVATQLTNTTPVLYRIVPIYVYNGQNKCKIFAFLDEGSGPTLLDKKVADNLQLSGRKKNLCLRWTDGTTHREQSSEELAMVVSSVDNPERKFTLNKVNTVQNLDLPKQTLNMQEMIKTYSYLDGLPIEPYENIIPQMIIGINNKAVSIPLKCIEGRWNEPAATKTRLGWALYGILNNQESVPQSRMLNLHICECDDNLALDKLMEQMNRAEDVPCVHATRKKHDSSLQVFDEVMKIEDGRYIVRLLWNKKIKEMPDNYSMAMSRLKCFEKKLEADHDLKIKVNEIIENMLKKGYVRKVSPGEIATATHRKWCLPTFIVRNPNKPHKVRLVWDAAAKFRGVSLNDCLEKGPDLLNSLVTCLFNFRLGKVGVCGDIEEMFHRVMVHEEDQMAQLFLWRYSKNEQPETFAMRVLTFGASCSPALAQYAKNKNTLRFAEEYPRAAKSIIKRHYMDDMMDSTDSVDEAIELAKQVREIHRHGNFRIRNWLSNSSEVLNALDDNGNPKEFCQSENNPEQVFNANKVLGMWWDTNTDTFTFSLKFTKTSFEILEGRELPTKRKLLRLLMSIFDPLGLVNHFLIDMKILLQEIWKSKIDWDQQIPDGFGEAWRKWLEVLKQISNVKVPRHYGNGLDTTNGRTELHMFMDAGEKAYAVVAYLRMLIGDSVVVSLVGSKAKVAPIRPTANTTIPRLELMAAVMAVRFGEIILNGHEMKLTRTTYWCDSKTVLTWIRSDPMKYKQFVKFRIGEIQEVTKEDQWRYIPTNFNVADLATKTSVNPNIDLSSEWFTGPKFLKLPKSVWPQWAAEEVEDSAELKTRSVTVAVNIEVSPLIDVTRISKYERLLRTIAQVKLFINKVKKTDSGENVVIGQPELKFAENYLIKLAQHDTYAAEIEALKRKPHENLPKTSVIRKLSPFLDENSILRMRGRLENVKEIVDAERNPIILPRDHTVTRLLVDWYHRRYKHINHEVVVNEIFQKYHVVGLRRLLKSVRGSCQFCRIRTAQPKPPEMGALPEERVTAYFRAFTNVGIDFFGPFMTISGRKTEKRYGVIFTCLTVRAVHVELAFSLNMSSCCSVIRNFMARRGVPRTIYSDNGTNLRAAEKELKTALEEVKFDELQAEFTNLETKWVFLPPGSPHMGGAWERMVRSIKQAMHQVITPNTKLTDEKLINLLTEAEAIVNSRPLSYLSLETAEKEVLTPNHFLLGSSSGLKPPGKFVPTDEFMKKSWRHTQWLADQFWKRWVAEVLPMMNKRTKWYDKAEPLREGDVVIICDPNSPRYVWPKGVVQTVVLGKDGQTRSAIVRTANGLYHRPTVKLAKIDVDGDRRE